MSREFKKTFFSSLLVVLLVISNLLSVKYTSFLDLTVPVSDFVFPFTFLCTLMLVNLGGKKVAYRGVLIASLIQIFITISYAIAVRLGIQTEIPDLAVHVNKVFDVNEMNLLASIVAFITSNCLLIYIYDIFKKYKKEFLGIALGLLAALFSNTIIFELIASRENDFMFIINMLLSNIIVSIIMLIIITIIFYILKEKDYETVEIKNIDKQKNADLAIEDVMLEKNETKPKPVKKKTTNKKNNYNNNYNNNRNSKKNNSKTQKNSQKKVNKKVN